MYGHMSSLPIDASRIVGASPSPVTVWDSKRLRQFRHDPQAQALYAKIDELGRGSKVAQGLNNVLTSCERLHDNPSHRLYLLARGKDFIGVLKMGTKKLFIRTKTGDLKEIDPMCVLDFYVVESEQRSGFGRVLYDAVLEQERVQPHQLGYDRPSPKFLGFLRKHFGLSDFVPQTNNFVVFEQYFSGSSTAGPRASGAPGLARTSVGPTARQQQPTAYGNSGGVDVSSSSAVPQPNRGQPPVPTPLNRPMQATLPSASRPGPAGGMRPAGGAPSMSAALAATLPSKSSPGSAAAPAGGLGASRGRQNSPTRSSAQYNIITLADGQSPVDAPPPQPAHAGPLSRSYGRHR